MKTFVLTVSEHFPLNHKRAGEKTGFPEAILNLSKIHTIRANYGLWYNRIKEVQAGKACLSIRKWEGKPYRSKQIEIVRLTNADNVGVQKVRIYDLWATVYIGERHYIRMKPETIAINDGLTIEDFKEWFNDYPYGLQMAIIHFTSFRYC